MRVWKSKVASEKKKTWREQIFCIYCTIKASGDPFILILQIGSGINSSKAWVSLIFARCPIFASKIREPFIDISSPEQVIISHPNRLPLFLNLPPWQLPGKLHNHNAKVGSLYHMWVETNASGFGTYSLSDKVVQIKHDWGPWPLLI